MPEHEYQIEMSGIRKSFGRATALLNVDFSVRRGEIHALLGAEGSGKSTLIHVLAGLCAPDGGEIRLGGRSVRMESPADSLRHGISAVCSESGLVPGLSVAENIFLGGLHGRGGILDRRGMKRRAGELLEAAGFGHIRPDAAAGSLNVASMQLVEICRAMARGSRTLLLDDPAAELGMKEAERLFRLLKSLRSKGMSIVCACGRAEDAFALADRLTGLEGGLSSAAAGLPSAEAYELAGVSAGRVKAFFPARSADIGGRVMSAEHIRAEGAPGDLSFELREGEILGLAGLAGDGRTEALCALFGGLPLAGGTVSLYGRRVRIDSPDSLADLGIAFLPEEYRRHVPPRGAGGLGTVFREGLAGIGGEFASIARRQANLPGRSRQQGRDAEAVSRGERQKAVLEALNAGEARILALDEPTRGLNADARTEIYRTIGDMAKKGRAVIIASSDLEEIAGMCDRAVVVRGGRDVCVLEKGGLSAASLLRQATEG
jgi:ABC-type sugar transport system ATPase subunit